MPPSPNNSVESVACTTRPMEGRAKRITLLNTTNVESDLTHRAYHRPDHPETSSSHQNGPQLNGLQLASYVREVDRLNTFERWPVPFLSGRQMAAAGFYYVKRDDVVRCAFCGLEVGCWVEGDDPMEDHGRWSPACRFVRKLPVGNIPIEADENPETPTRENGYDTCGQYGIEIRPLSSVSGPEENRTSPSDDTLLENLGIQKCRPPSFPNFSLYEARMRSFDSWPISLKLKPLTLSDAGFFYTGKGDQTICYHCGGGLKDWEESDEPWVEHARWFSKCPFVLTNKGKDFVAMVCGTKTSDEVVKSTGSSTTSGESKAPVVEERIVPPTATSLNTECEASTSATTCGSSSNSGDSRLCKICFTDDVGVLFLPCGHLVACVKCALSMTTCAVCRKPYTATVRAFLS